MKFPRSSREVIPPYLTNRTFGPHEIPTFIQREVIPPYLTYETGMDASF
jgi:hypothetical protein